MDINGAKALKQRLGPNGGDEAPRAFAGVDIPEGVPPVFHWVGVPQAKREIVPSDEDGPESGATLFRRLGLSFR